MKLSCIESHLSCAESNIKTDGKVHQEINQRPGCQESVAKPTWPDS